jgi:hypothetical protein
VPMAHPIAPPSGLPTFMMPCPHCRHRMSIKSIAPTQFAPELEDITHACDHCGSELVRTVKSASVPKISAAKAGSTRAA